jgi:methionine-rich copper-binding protein CopC
MRAVRLAIAVLLTLAPSLARAHAELVRSMPARRAVLVRPPDRVQLWFNERLEPAFSRLSVWDASDTQVDLADAEVGTDDPKRLAVGLRPIGPGTYRVRFRVLSVDGHVVESEFAFTVKAP